MKPMWYLVTACTTVSHRRMRQSICPIRPIIESHLYDQPATRVRGPFQALATARVSHRSWIRGGNHPSRLWEETIPAVAEADKRGNGGKDIAKSVRYGWQQPCRLAREVAVGMLEKRSYDSSQSSLLISTIFARRPPILGSRCSRRTTHAGLALR